MKVTPKIKAVPESKKDQQHRAARVVKELWNESEQEGKALDLAAARFTRLIQLFREFKTVSPNFAMTFPTEAYSRALGVSLLDFEMACLRYADTYETAHQGTLNFGDVFED